MQALEHAEELIGILHIEADPVIPNEDDGFAVLSAGGSDFNFSPRAIACELNRVGQKIDQDQP
jgi:hypothetical protein